MSWEKISLGRICTMLSGNAWSASKFKDAGTIPLIRIQNLGNNENEKFIYWNDPFDEKFIVKKGDILLSLSGSIKVDVWDGVDALLNQRIVRLTPNYDVDHKWFFWQITSIILDIERMGKWALVNNVSITDLKEIQIPLPPLATQKRIAEILDAADALRRKDQELLKKYDELAQAIFIDMFGDPVKNEKGWEYGTIRDLSAEVKYGTSKPAEDNGSIPYLRMNNITYSGDWDISNLKYINLLKTEYEKYIVKNRDLVFNRTNSKELVGKTAVFNLGKEMAIAGYLIRLRTNDKANPYYISSYLNSKHGKKTLLGMCKSIVGMANINAQELQEIEIMIPPVDLQNLFEDRYEHIKTIKSKVEKQLEGSSNIFDSLIQKAFKGELVA
jgi:type I restriction enzyme S subunit